MEWTWKSEEKRRGARRGSSPLPLRPLRDLPFPGEMRAYRFEAPSLGHPCPFQLQVEGGMGFARRCRGARLARWAQTWSDAGVALVAAPPLGPAPDAWRGGRRPPANKLPVGLWRHASAGGRTRKARGARTHAHTSSAPEASSPAWPDFVPLALPETSGIRAPRASRPRQDPVSPVGLGLVTKRARANL